MFNDEFKNRYTTIPFALYRAFTDHKEETVISHYHREIELIAMTEGSAEFYVNSQYFKLEKGDILVIPPYAIHRANTSSNTVSSYDCICFDLKLLCDDTLKEGLENDLLETEFLVMRTTSYAGYISSCISKACAACENNETGWELEAIGNMSLLFSELKKNSCFVPKFKDKNKKDFSKLVMAYITDNFSEPITSATAANALFMSNGYFCRIFKNNFGCCFSEYLLLYRLEKSKYLLKNTSTIVSKIAFQTGFNNCSYFGKTFKEKFGISPLSYRKKYQDHCVHNDER